MTDNLVNSINNLVNNTDNKVIAKNKRIHQPLSMNHEKIHLVGIYNACPICKGTKTSRLEMNCSFCDEHGNLNQNGELLLRYNKRQLQLLGLIKSE